MQGDLSWNREAAVSKVTVNTVVARLRLTVVGAKNLLPADRSGLSDPYVEILFEGVRKVTGVKSQTLSPMWMQDFAFDVRDLTDEVTFRIWDKDTLTSDDFLGEARLQLSDVSFDASTERELALGRGGASGAYAADATGVVVVRAAVARV